MNDYIDPVTGIWLAILLWGTLIYMVWRGAQRGKVKVRIIEENGQFYVTVYKYDRHGYKVIMGQTILQHHESISDYVAEVIGHR